MITGILKNKINAIWQDFYNENMAQTSDIVNQLTTLMFIKMLDDKQIAEQGTREELLALNGAYAALEKAQELIQN